MRIANTTNTNTTNTTTTTLMDSPVRVYPLKSKLKDGTVANVSLTYGPVFVGQIKLKETSKGLIVDFPKKKGKDGKDYTVFWFEDGVRENVIEMIKDVYNNQVEGTPLSVTPLPVNETISAEVRKYEKDNTLGFATVKVGGLTIYDVVLMTKKNNPDEAYLRFPQVVRMNKGERVVDGNGNWVYDSYAGPNSKEARELIENAVFEAYSEDAYVEE